MLRGLSLFYTGKPLKWRRRLGEVEKTGVTLHVSTYRHDPRRASSSVCVATGEVVEQGR